MAITKDQLWQLHKGSLHSEEVRLALAGFLVAHFQQGGVFINPDIFGKALEEFAKVLGDPKALTTITAQWEAAKAERRKGMH